MPGAKLVSISRREGIEPHCCIQALLPSRWQRNFKHRPRWELKKNSTPRLMAVLSKFSRSQDHPPHLLASNTTPPLGVLAEPPALRVSGTAAQAALPSPTGRLVPDFSGLGASPTWQGRQHVFCSRRRPPTFADRQPTCFESPVDSSHSRERPAGWLPTARPHCRPPAPVAACPAAFFIQQAAQESGFEPAPRRAETQHHQPDRRKLRPTCTPSRGPGAGSARRWPGRLRLGVI